MLRAATPIDVVREYIDALNRGDWQHIERLLHPSFQRHSVAAGGSGVESAADFIGFLQREHAMYPDAREEILDIFASDSKVAARHLFTGTQLGARVRSIYIALYRVEEGRLAESWAEWDNLADLQQLGRKI